MDLTPYIFLCIKNSEFCGCIYTARAQFFKKFCVNLRILRMDPFMRGYLCSDLIIHRFSPVFSFPIAGIIQGIGGDIPLTDHDMGIFQAKIMFSQKGFGLFCQNGSRVHAIAAFRFSHNDANQFFSRPAVINKPAAVFYLLIAAVAA